MILRPILPSSKTVIWMWIKLCENSHHISHIFLLFWAWVYWIIGSHCVQKEPGIAPKF